MRRSLLTALPLLLLLSACASMPPQTNETLRIQVFESVPNVPWEGMNKKVTVSHGSGIGLFGLQGSRRGMIGLLQIKAVEHGADAVAIDRAWRRGNAYVAEGILLRLPTFSYTPPVEPPDVLEEFRPSVEKSYDGTWTDLVDAVASTFFEVKSFEKALGLLTLEYDARIPEDYVDGGRWKRSYPNGEVGFDGSYLDRPAAKDLSINAKINLRVEEVTPNRTEVEITALGTPNFRTCRATRELERGLLALINES